MSEDLPRSYTDMQNIRIGFDILARYDDTGQGVSAGYRFIAAGPCGEPFEIFIEDQELLDRYGWQYDEDIERWVYHT